MGQKHKQPRNNNQHNTDQWEALKDTPEGKAYWKGHRICYLEGGNAEACVEKGMRFAKLAQMAGTSDLPVSADWRHAPPQDQPFAVWAFLLYRERRYQSVLNEIIGHDEPHQERVACRMGVPLEAKRP